MSPLSAKHFSLSQVKIISSWDMNDGIKLASIHFFSVINLTLCQIDSYIFSLRIRIFPIFPHHAHTLSPTCLPMLFIPFLFGGLLETEGKKWFSQEMTRWVGKDKRGTHQSGVTCVSFWDKKKDIALRQIEIEHTTKIIFL